MAPPTPKHPVRTSTTDTGGIQTFTITTASAPFHVNIASAGGKVAFESETHLNVTWLSKPLREALVGPAVKAYCSSHPSSPQDVEVSAVRVSVDGKPVSGTAAASEYVRTDGSPALVELTLPMVLDIRVG